MEHTASLIKGGNFLVSKIEPEQTFTPEDMTDEHKLIAKTARQFVEKEVMPQREAIENQDFDLTVQLLQQAGELGLLAHSIPEHYGGLELDKISKGIVGEAVGRAGGYGVAHSNHTCIATLPITYFGTKEQKKKYLPKLASGEYLGAYCLTEPGAGSDALSSQTTAVLNDEGTYYRLNGIKLYITNAIFSTTFIVYAKVDGKYFTAFLVEKDFQGLSLGPEENKMGIKGSSTRSVILEDCLVPVENVLGEVGKGHVIALNVLNLGRFNLGFACVGAAKGALKSALAHISERTQFGRSIAEFNASKEKTARMTARLYAAESIQYRTAGLLESALGSLDDSADNQLVGSRMMEHALECAICKVYGSETLDYVVDEALQLHGGAGFIKEYPIEQAYRDSRINRIFEGTNEINRLLIPAVFLKKAAKGQFSFASAIQQAETELHSALEAEHANVSAAIAAFRNIFLLCIGAAYEKHAHKLEEEQEIGMKLADLAILLFAAESAVLRTEKAAHHHGSFNVRLKEQLTISFIEDTALEVEMIAKKLLSGLLEGEKRSSALQLLSQVLTVYQTTDAVQRNRSIAEQIYEAGQFNC